MTRRRAPSPACFDVPAGATPAAQTTSGPPSVDVTVSEWTVDLAVLDHMPSGTAVSSGVAEGYVDFDVIDTLRSSRPSLTVGVER